MVEVRGLVGDDRKVKYKKKFLAPVGPPGLGLGAGSKVRRTLLAAGPVLPNRGSTGFERGELVEL